MMTNTDARTAFEERCYDIATEEQAIIDACDAGIIKQHTALRKLAALRVELHDAEDTYHDDDPRVFADAWLQ